MQIKKITRRFRQIDQVVKKWQMLLNFGKCKCIHIGHGNMDEEYKMGILY